MAIIEPGDRGERTSGSADERAAACVAGNAITDERRHTSAAIEEWLFTCWTADVGVISGWRVVGRLGWYWAAVARPGHRPLHIADWAVPVRANHLVVKSDGLWAEHVCDAPMEQWTVANETFATALDDPGDALGRGYGTPTAVAFDLEWYATGPAESMAHGYGQAGVVHGSIELAGAEGIELDEAPAHRWHRWGDRLAPVSLGEAHAHTGVRAPFAFPDGTVADWVLTPDGWRARR